GRNHDLHVSLIDLVGSDPRFTIFGFTRRIPALMARADILITKPGGITCSEAMAARLPMLLLEPLPGHEEDNAAYLTRTGAACLIHAGSAGSAVTNLLVQEPVRLAAMREAAASAGRPRAAEAIANQIFTLSKANRHHSATA
ncbi:MAG TPA: glycosyltransferase, partial [Symbiobacteriaceae bacterium]|nr:glycosyltransferase [Symbiobacteriaceae bacterium]